MDESEKIKTCLEWLKVRGFEVKYAPGKEAARKIVTELVPPDWIVGIGDSATIRSLGVIQDLADLGNRVLNPFITPKIMRDRPGSTPLHVLNQASHGCDVFLASSNAVTMDGKLVNIDGGGNRVSGIIFGSRLRIIVVGRNKIVKDVNEAIYRIKNVLAPAHGRTVGADWGIPCVTAGKCVEPETVCKAGRSRMCNVLVVLESAPNMGESRIVVVLVDDDLGLGWEPTWPQDRIDKIYAEYKKFTPPHRSLKKPES